MNVPLVVFGAAMARVMCSYFATRDYYANALYVSVCATADGVRIELHVPGRALRFARVPRSIEVPRSAVERVFRCGPFGGTALVVLAPERGLPPMMVSWRVVRLLGLTGRATRARRGWCRQVVTDGELPR